MIDQNVNLSRPSAADTENITAHVDRKPLGHMVLEKLSTNNLSIRANVNILS
jgi:hypothetical protein